MKSKGLKNLLVLIAIVYAIRSQSQTVLYQTVPDSLTCITPSQDAFFIGQAFTIKSLRTSLILKDKEISGYQSALIGMQSQINEAHNQTKLMTDNYNNSQKDLKVKTDELDSIENKTLIQKVALWVSIPLNIIGAGYVAIDQIIKKASN